MSLMPTAPGTVGSVLDNAIRLYRRVLFPCFPLVLIAVLLTTIPAVMLNHIVQPLAKDDPLAVLALFKNFGVLLGYLVLMAIYAVVYGALIAQIDAMAHDKRMPLGEALGIGFARAPTMLGVFILVGFLVGLGFVLLIIPGIWLWGMFQLSILPPIVERTGAYASMETSRRLIKGNWWRANITVFVAFILVMVLMMVVSAVAGIIVGIFSASSANLGDAADAAAAVAGAAASFQLAQQILSAVVNLFTMTFLPSVMLCVYYDLKLRKEGADLAERVGTLNPSS